MGPNTSVDTLNPNHASISFEAVVPDGYSRISPQSFKEPSLFAEIQTRSKLINFGFVGKWSVTKTNSPCPQPRTGHFTCVSEKTQMAYIGYGNGKDGEQYDDLWALDLNTLVWRNIPLMNPLSHRTGARALVAENKIVVFGGYDAAAMQYLTQLHTIDVETGEVKLIEGSGDLPEPRTMPLLAFHSSKLFVWGGYNGTYLSDISIFDAKTDTWSRVDSDVPGRSGAPFAQVGNTLYSYGGSSSDGLLSTDLEKSSLKLIPSLGTPPAAKNACAGMVAVDHFLFYCGGNSEDAKAFVHAYDIISNHWFIFHVKPDRKTVSYEDGQVVKGDFKLPNIHSFGIAYSNLKREILGFLGSSIHSGSKIFMISVGKPLSVLHLMDDMREMSKLQ